MVHKPHTLNVNYYVTSTIVLCLPGILNLSLLNAKCKSNFYPAKNSWCTHETLFLAHDISIVVYFTNILSLTVVICDMPINLIPYMLLLIVPTHNEWNGKSWLLDANVVFMMLSSKVKIWSWLLANDTTELILYTT